MSAGVAEGGGPTLPTEGLWAQVWPSSRPGLSAAPFHQAPVPGLISRDALSVSPPHRLHAHQGSERESSGSQAAAGIGIPGKAG